VKYNYQGNGIIFKLSSLEESVTYDYINISSLAFNGAGEYNFVYSSNNTSGTLFSFGEKVESLTYGYTDPSALEFNTDDYGILTELHLESIDYGNFSLEEDQEDSGLITILETTQPFGGITLSGSANTEWINKNFYGSGECKVVYSPDNTSGTLFSFGEKVESRTYDYTDPSALEFNTDDYGILTELHLESIDYEDLSLVDNREDNGLIAILETTQPFGGITLSGSANTEWINTNFYGSGECKVVYSPDNTSGTLFSFGEKVESRTYDYTDPSALEFNTDDYGSISEAYLESIDYGDFSLEENLEDNGLIVILETIQPFGGITFSGSANTEWISKNFYGFGEYKVVYSPDNTSGTLFSFGEKVESVTYTYTDPSALEFNTDDYGSISEAYLESIDYENLSPTENLEDNGLIAILETSQPFGGITLSGSALTQPNYRLFLFGKSEVRLTYSPDNTSGTLFSFGEKIESRTYVYDETDIVTFDELDYGFVSNVYDQIEDYEFVSDSADTNIDNGLLTGFGATETITPFGELTVSGSAVESFSAQTPEDTQLFSISGSAFDAYSAQTPENTQLFTVSGSALENDTESYVASGTLFSFGEKIESRTYVYDETTIFTFDELDYGFVNNVYDQIEDYEFVFDPADANIDNGLLTGFGATETITPFGELTVSGSAVEKFTADTPEDTQLFSIFGSALEKDTESYVGIGNLEISGSALENDTESYVASGTLFSFGEKIESRTYVYDETTIVTFDELDYGFVSNTSNEIEDYEFVFDPADANIDNGLLTGFGATETITPFGELTASGSAVESFSAQTPEDTQLFSIFGELVHPNIDYTPHYGIERNIGIGTIGIQFSGSALENDTGSYVSSGVINLGKIYIGDNQFSSNQTTFDSTLETFDDNSFIFSSALESFSAQIPENTQLFSISGSAFDAYSAQTPEDTVLYTFIGDARTYSPIYPRNAIPGDPGSGIGTIRINDDAGLTITRAVLPYFGRGTIFLNGVGLESFAIVNYNGSGTLSFSGISSSREINVYQDYVTSGIITISQQTQPITEKHTESYVGIGTIIKFATLSERVVNDYTASGSINLGKIIPTVGTEVIFSSALESFSAQTPEDTVLYTFSGSALEAYSAQTPEDTVLYTFIGSLVENITKSYSGEGLISLNGNATERIVVDPPASGNIRFTTRLSDNLYDTCDSVDITSDYENSALVRFIANPPESTQLFNIFGFANTSEINVYEYVGVGNLTFSGSLVERQTDSYVGIGTLFTVSDGSEINVNSYGGSGSLFAISGSSESKSSQTPENTILVNIFGTASTKLESEYSYSGIVTAYIDGSASTLFDSNYVYSGIGAITLSGELVYPDIRFIPAFKTSGLFTISGISSNSISRVGILSGNRNLFAFSGGFESFSKSTYIGLGTIYTEEVSSIAINNPFQIPRTYVVII
jgi:hypothetical protein